MSGTGRRSSSTDLAQALILLLLFVLPRQVPCAKASRVTPAMRNLSGEDDDGGEDDDNKQQGSLLGVMHSSISAISKLHAVVSGYQQDHHLKSDIQSQALLSDCADLTSDSKDAVHDSLSILVKLQDTQKTNATTDHRESDSDMDDLRTNLSAALTDITTCTDELHDELPDEAPEQMKKAVSHIGKQAGKASQLLSKALNLAASP